MSNLTVLERYDSKYLESAWDNKILNYDTNKYDWEGLFLHTIQEKIPSIENLNQLHLHITFSQIPEIRRYLEAMTRGEYFQSLIDQFFEEYVSPLLPNTDFMVQTVPGIRLVLPDQEQQGKLLPWHTGHHTGYNNGIYSIWTPVTKTWDTNAMQVLSWDDTIEVMNKFQSDQMSLYQLQELCRPKAFPTTTDVGQSWLFNQGHLHGNFNNSTGASRVSFDTRALIKGTDYGCRYPGGFYRIRGENNKFKIPKHIDNRNWIVFSDQGSDYIGSIPQFIIREFMMQWCNNHNITPYDWQNEYLHVDWSPNLKFFMEMGTAKGSIFPSIYALSSSIEERFKIFKQALDNNIHMIFIDENIYLDSVDALEYIKKIYAFAYPRDKIAN